MKKVTLFIALIALTNASCLKKRTCTCKDSAGNVVSESKTTTTKSGIKTFEDNCNNKKTVESTSAGTKTTPCELSQFIIIVNDR